MRRPVRPLAAKVVAKLLRAPRPRAVPDVVLKRARPHAAQLLAKLSRNPPGGVAAPPRDGSPARLAMQAGLGTGTYKEELVKDAAAKQHRPRRKAKADDERLRLARERARRHAQLRAAPGRTKLETLVVQEPTRKSYVMLLRALVSHMWGRSAERALTPHPSVTEDVALETLAGLDGDADLDDAVAEFLNDTYWQGEAGATGYKMLAAVGWLLPRFQKEGAGTLPRGSRAALAGRRRAPGKSRMPLPEPLVYAIAMAIAWRFACDPPRHDRAVAVMLGFRCYLRPKEINNLRWRDVAGSRGAGQGKAWKTHEYDETAVVARAWLARVLEVKPQRPADSSVIGESPREMQSAVAWAVAAWKIMRHSGASADWLAGRRGRTETRDRGRWRADALMRRCGEGGKAAEQLDRCSTPLRRYALACQKMLPSILLGSRPAWAPPRGDL